MALYAIADTHLSFGTDKPMDSFPAGAIIPFAWRPIGAIWWSRRIRW